VTTEQIVRVLNSDSSSTGTVVRIESAGELTISNKLGDEVTLSSLRNVVAEFAKHGFALQLTSVSAVVARVERVNLLTAVWESIKAPLFWSAVGAGLLYIRSIEPSQWRDLINGAVFQTNQAASPTSA
jgi:hypothetical protein